MHGIQSGDVVASVFVRNRSDRWVLRGTVYIHKSKKEKKQ